MKKYLLKRFSQVFFVVLFAGVIVYSILLNLGLQEVRFGNSVEEYVTEHQSDYGTFKQQIAWDPVNIDNQTYQTRVVMTDEGKYMFLYEGTDKKLVAVHQTAPEYQWVKGTLPITPTVAALVAVNPDVGTPIRMEDDNTVVTDKGKYTVIYLGETAHELMQDGKRVAVQTIPLTVTDRTRLYLEGLDEKTGKVRQLILSEWHPDKQSFYIEAEKGLFRLNEYYTGAADLAKAK